MAIILAINSGIGSSVGIFKNGTPELCIEEERFSRIKNHMGFPHLALKYFIENYGIDIHKIQYVVLPNSYYSSQDRKSFYKYYSDSFKKSITPLSIFFPIFLIKSFLRYTIKNNPRLFKLYKIVLSSDKDKETLISMGFLSKNIIRLDHHLCHAAYSYYGLSQSLQKEHLVFTLDGGGDQYTSCVFRGQSGNLTRLSSSSCYSIGNIYSAVTAFLGFRPHEHEYKLMGLAPYVNEDYAKVYKPFFSRYLKLTEDDTVFYNPLLIDHSRFFGILKSSMVGVRFDNLAAALQMFTEEIVIRWIKGNVRKYGISRVLCSGGVFMNVKLNLLVSKLPEVSFVDVGPSCGDETNIFGAAFYQYNNSTHQSKKQVGLLDKFTLGTTPSYDIDSAIKKYKGEISVEKTDTPNAFIADQLAKNKIVARCTGQMEFGARALGNRSIMANPKHLNTVNKINMAVKKRDYWMPFAPAMLWDKASQFIKVPPSLEQQGSPYMMFAFETCSGVNKDISCGIHQADYTARAETLTKDRYPDFYDIVSQFHNQTGIPVVLNTSFNLHGFPIVENSSQAIHVLINSKIDVLVIDNFIITRT